MRSPAAAIAWEFHRRHRWGMLALLAYLAVLAAIKVVVGHPVDFESEQTFALVVVVPMTATFLYFLGVFSFGLSGDLAARQSMYPARMFTLPVTTAALAGWPMLFGAAAMAVLWFATRFLAIWPSDKVVPMFWPALLAASLLAWTQALTWMPYPLPGLRVAVTMLWLGTFDAIVLIALEKKTPEPVMLAFLAPHVPIAYVAARWAVVRARRGETGTQGHRAARWRRGTLAYPTPARAQAWLEWRQHGRSLPLMVAILLPLELLLLFAFSEAPSIIFEILTVALLTPPAMAAFVAATVSGRVTPFLATRPMTSASLIGAKLKVAMWSTVIAWILVLAAIPIALRLSGTMPVVAGWAHDAVRILGLPRAVTLALLALALLVASTWKQLVQSLYIGMSGREWLVKASVFATLAILSVVLPVAHWLVQNRKAMAMLWNLFPWIAAVFIGVKLAVAVWIAGKLYDRGLVRRRTLIGAALGWDALVLALYALLAWSVPTLLFRAYFLVLVAMLAVPLVRLAAAPLALDWNRHR
ncbi:MAG TPA: hypothetical protein VJZ76_20605 [Thermoanaerobaculia bacterium]|nr:hypothetical protein [Thermoanaerobaculia bacterium]